MQIKCDFFSSPIPTTCTHSFVGHLEREKKNLRGADGGARGVFVAAHTSLPTELSRGALCAESHSSRTFKIRSEKFFGFRSRFMLAAVPSCCPDNALNLDARERRPGECRTVGCGA